MKKLLNRETVSYLIFGVLTTIVSYLVFCFGTQLFGEANALWVNAASFLAAASFAYVTNKRFVFESKSWTLSVLRKELPAFFGARIVSFLLEEAGLWICLELLHADRYQLLGISGIMIAKILLSLVVVVLNYIFSKLFIFRHSKKEAPPHGNPYN